jgi:hypothetical protein
LFEELYLELFNTYIDRLCVNIPLKIQKEEKPLRPK